jgi:hypothetical protein
VATPAPVGGVEVELVGPFDAEVVGFGGRRGLVDKEGALAAPDLEFEGAFGVGEPAAGVNEGARGVREGVVGERGEFGPLVRAPGDPDYAGGVVEVAAMAEVGGHWGRVYAAGNAARAQGLRFARPAITRSGDEDGRVAANGLPERG